MYILGWWWLIVSRNTTESSASVLQGVKATITTGVKKDHLTYIPDSATRSSMWVCMENIQYTFLISSFLLLICFSSSPIALAHERWGIWKRFYHSILRHTIGCIPLCILFQSDMRKSTDDAFSATSYLTSPQDIVFNNDTCNDCLARVKML